MKKVLLLPLLIFASCTNNSTEVKEKELLEKELELTKKELELTKQENQQETSDDSNSASTANKEALVFSTSMLSNPKKVTINGKTYSIVIKQEFVELNDGAPDEYTSTIIFKPGNLPQLKVGAELGSFAVKDLNGDGTEELIALTHGNSTWGSIETYRITDKNKWIQPFDSFMWWTMEEGCDAEMYWSAGKKQMRIKTTNASNEKFDCTEVIKANWK